MESNDLVARLHSPDYVRRRLANSPLQTLPGESREEAIRRTFEDLRQTGSILEPAR